MPQSSTTSNRTASASPASGWAESWGRLIARGTAPILDAKTEAEFRAWYLRYVRSRVRVASWMPLVVLLLVLFAPGPFDALRHAWFGETYHIAIDVLRFGVVLPTTLAIMAITYTSLYDRYYSFAAQIVAPAHGICFAAMDVMMRPNGYTLSSWMVIVVLASYFMYGMLLMPGVLSVLIVLSSYATMGWVAGLDSAQWRMDLGAMVFAATFAGYVFYSLHSGVRASYLEHREMSDHIHRDALTGIHNRRLFDEHMQKLWQRALHEGKSLGLLIADIDHFKNYNDSLGHQAGDESLAKIAKILSAGARRQLDLAARYGGEEFAILLYNVDRQSLDELAEHLRSQVVAAGILHPASPAHPFVTVSIGGACITPVEGRSPFGFVQLADEALYAAKERGRNHVVIMDHEYVSLKTGVFRSFKTDKGVAA